MNKLYLTIILIIFIIIGLQCKTSNEAASGDLNALVKSTNDFALGLYSELKDTEGNLFFSPYSISAALTMTYGGARGKTADEMEKVLNIEPGQNIHLKARALNQTLLESQGKGKVQLNIANSIYPQTNHEFLNDYVKLLKENYGVSITPVDYTSATEEARQLINQWVEDQTEGKIKELIVEGSLDPSTLLTLVNAIYFKGNWLKQFDPTLTRRSDFRLQGGDKVSVLMMQQGGHYRINEVDNAQILDIPYGGKRLSFMIILPQEPTGIAELENTITSQKLQDWIAGMVQQEAVIFLPKFKITWGTFDLGKPLKNMGMNEAFLSGKADFSGMDGSRDLFISLVLHKAFIEVNEEGTEAAASTAVVMKKGPGPRIFRVDRPFLFLIRDNTTGSILFMGKMLNPIEKAD